MINDCCWGDYEILYSRDLHILAVNDLDSHDLHLLAVNDLENSEVVAVFKSRWWRRNFSAKLSDINMVSTIPERLSRELIGWIFILNIARGLIFIIVSRCNTESNEVFALKEAIYYQGHQDYLIKLSKRRKFYILVL